MPDRFYVSVDDNRLAEKFQILSKRELVAAERRAITKVTRFGRQLLKSATKGTLRSNPKRILSSPAGYKPPKVKTVALGVVQGHVGYSGPGFYGRFLSAGTGPRVQKTTGRFTGQIQPGSGVVPQVTKTVDALTPKALTLEIARTVRKVIG